MILYWFVIKKLSVGIFIFWNLHLRFFLITFKSKYNYFYKSGTVLIILVVAEMTYGAILPENIMYDSELMLNSFFTFLSNEMNLHH